MTYNLENLFSAVTTHMMDICVKFHRNPSIKYRDFVSREIGVDGQRMDGRTDGTPENAMPLAAYIVGGGGMINMT